MSNHLLSVSQAGSSALLRPNSVWQLLLMLKPAHINPAYLTSNTEMKQKSPVQAIIFTAHTHNEKLNLTTYTVMRTVLMPVFHRVADPRWHTYGNFFPYPGLGFNWMASTNNVFDVDITGNNNHSRHVSQALSNWMQFVASIYQRHNNRHQLYYGIRIAIFSIQSRKLNSHIVTFGLRWIHFVWMWSTWVTIIVDDRLNINTSMTIQGYLA